jgi:hypothetical protein
MMFARQLIGKIAATAVVLSGLSLATTSIAAVTEISGAGATFPYPVYAKWAAAYAKETGVKLNYQSIGCSGSPARRGAWPPRKRPCLHALSLLLRGYRPQALDPAAGLLQARGKGVLCLESARKLLPLLAE